MSVLENYFTARVGYHTEVSISPESYTGTKAFLELNSRERKCQTSDAFEDLPVGSFW